MIYFAISCAKTSIRGFTKIKLNTAGKPLIKNEAIEKAKKNKKSLNLCFD
jgi:hypothetical protein